MNDTFQKAAFFFFKDKRSFNTCLKTAKKRAATAWQRCHHSIGAKCATKTCLPNSRMGCQGNARSTVRNPTACKTQKAWRQRWSFWKREVPHPPPPGHAPAPKHARLLGPMMTPGIPRRRVAPNSAPAIRNLQCGETCSVGKLLNIQGGRWHVLLP